MIRPPTGCFKRLNQNIARKLISSGQCTSILRKNNNSARICKKPHIRSYNSTVFPADIRALGEVYFHIFYTSSKYLCFFGLFYEDTPLTIESTRVTTTRTCNNVYEGRIFLLDYSILIRKELLVYEYRSDGILNIWWISRAWYTKLVVFCKIWNRSPQQLTSNIFFCDISLPVFPNRLGWPNEERRRKKIF